MLAAPLRKASQIYESFGPGEVATIAGADVTLSVDELYASALEAG
jgi:hypothetical protein